jgi:hypothetical protein
VDRDGVSPELSSDIEELNRRRAGIAVGWATVEAQNRRRSRVYGLAGAAWVAGLLVAVSTAMFLPVYLSEHGVLAEGTLGWLTTVSSLGTMAVGCGLHGWWYVASGRPGRTADTGLSGLPATGDGGGPWPRARGTRQPRAADQRPGRRPGRRRGGCPGARGLTGAASHRAGTAPARMSGMGLA